MFATSVIGTDLVNLDHAQLVVTIEALRQAGASVLTEIDSHDLTRAVAPLTDAALAVRSLASQARWASNKTATATSKDVLATATSPPTIVSSNRNASPEVLIQRYLAAHPEIPNYDDLADKIGISRDVLFAIKGETRWARPVAYQSTAILIGCSEQDLHPRQITRKRRKGRGISKVRL